MKCAWVAGLPALLLSITASGACADAWDQPFPVAVARSNG